ncbi:helix-turn-helix transcriptional regulator (plasmid) [Rhizobium sp. 32-5/1]|uniref:helix-turn-helix transcriptional regulator n=1 Tax=Rhizobium sp. 32-5/1 TaxID=3019602 RepID=UPI00240E26BA|nr:helix-turn-helix transcriptional regulator [Rhizobium sp. 32-5/1]WEZ85331.1 helix-turn-helix transcriptional regulator [Rhizobium sp. 32-5/1]
MEKAVSEVARLTVANPGTVPEPVRLETMSGSAHPARRLDFTKTLAGFHNPSQKLSVFLLDLYAAAMREEVGRFERCFFSLLEELVAFDAGWTGVATQEDNRPVTHNSFVYHLPENFYREWLTIREHDPLADLTHLVYGQAAVTDIRQDDVDPVFRTWAEKFGLKHLMRTCALDTRFGLIGFLSIYRFDPNRPFSAEEVATIEALIPHLAAAMRINRTMQLFRLGKEVSTETRRAICDAYGVIHRADPGFAETITAAWPGWNGQRLPNVICQHLQSLPETPFLCTTHRIEINPIAGLFVLELRPRSLVDRLGSRELETIQHFANGASYKEVARRMDISPTTVRHHLRSAYKKLGVHNKTQMARLVGGVGARQQTSS